MEMSLHTNPRVFISAPLSRREIKPIRSIISCRVVNNNNNNFYKVLSLEAKQNAGFDEIKKAYRSMALQYHPDVCHPSLKEECTRRFLELQKAYETLSDPVSREHYDYELGLTDPRRERRDGGGYRSFRVPSSVWEKQLSQLQERSTLRMMKKKRGGSFK